MDHLVFLDSIAKELENLVGGNKSMIIRGSDGIKVPHGKVNEDDVLYFINDNGEAKVKARGVVTFVLNSNQLSQEESFETVIKYQDKLQLPDEQFYKWAGKRYLVLVGLDDITEIEPIAINKSLLSQEDDWIPLGNIENLGKNTSS